jgi:hypothetical protein
MTPCTHFWLLPLPDGPVAAATCKICGTEALMCNTPVEILTPQDWITSKRRYLPRKPWHTPDSPALGQTGMDMYAKSED